MPAMILTGALILLHSTMRWHQFYLAHTMGNRNLVFLFITLLKYS
uniref:Uncharacterized protein n=1 Tax=Anguilla anguilla TaxID=7936 RepID=A0A0E9PMJ8_ANGAN